MKCSSKLTSSGESSCQKLLSVQLVPAQLAATVDGALPQVRGAWVEDVRVVIAGLANTYSSYVTTFEEYGAQRYEGASTIFGPHTLDAYIQVRVAFASGLA